MTDMPPSTGRFVWYELVTPDKEASRRFYSALLGWQWLDYDMGDLGNYPMAHTGEDHHCGLISPQQEGMPAHWMAYVTVDDVDRACSQAAELGGKVLVPASDIPGIGRFAALEDPAGAVILPFRGSNPPPAERPEPAPVGFFCWNELLTTETAACEAFYREIFAWEVESSEMPKFGKYWVFRRGARLECGMMPMPPATDAPSHWLPYVSVSDVDAAVAAIAELGGQVYCRPTDIPETGRFAVAADPHGAVFAVFRAA